MLENNKEKLVSKQQLQRLKNKKIIYWIPRISSKQKKLSNIVHMYYQILLPHLSLEMI